MESALTHPVLLLNKHYTALRVIDVRRAMVLLFGGAAEAVDVEARGFYAYNFESWRDLSEFKAEFEADTCHWLRCVGLNLAVPQVVRLMRYAKPRPQRVRLSRKNIFTRDKNTCQYCGRHFKSVDLNLDHVLPKSRGGQMRWDNIVCSCIPCNTRKANRTPREASMKLIRPAVKPNHVTELIRIRHDSWKHFIEDAYWNVELTD